MKKRIWLLALLCMLTLAGCALPTVDQLYCIPARPQSYNDLQSVFDSAMKGLDYASPKNGENLQTVQMEDLDGDGLMEYLIFARDDGDKTLKILIFAPIGQRYVLVDTLPCSGTSFDRVEYAQMDGTAGVELVVGTRISEQVYRSAVVYSYQHGKARQLLSASYVRYFTTDLNADGLAELLVLRPGITGEDCGNAALFSITDGVGRRTNEVALSCPVEKVGNVQTGILSDGAAGVFITGEATQADTVFPVTDVLALSDGTLCNAALDSPTGTRVEESGSLLLMPADVDGDGQPELPAVVKVRDPHGALNQRIIRWYGLDSRGRETDKRYTWQDPSNDWYLELDSAWIGALRISQEDGCVSFYQTDADTGQAVLIFSVYTLTGQNREANAVIENRFMLHKTDQVIYAARLEVASGALSITQNDLIRSFRLLGQA